MSHIAVLHVLSQLKRSSVECWYASVIFDSGTYWRNRIPRLLDHKRLRYQPNNSRGQNRSLQTRVQSLPLTRKNYVQYSFMPRTLSHCPIRFIEYKLKTGVRRLLRRTQFYNMVKCKGPITAVEELSSVPHRTFALIARLIDLSSRGTNHYH